MVFGVGVLLFFLRVKWSALAWKKKELAFLKRFLLLNKMFTGEVVLQKHASRTTTSWEGQKRICVQFIAYTFFASCLEENFFFFFQ